MQLDHSKNLIEVKNVSFSYGATQVLSNVNFSVHRGDYVALVGGNGSGKSTLIKIILGLLTPDSGEVSLFGIPQKEFSERSKIGYVAQDATKFQRYFPVTAEQVVAMGRLGNRGMRSQDTVSDERAVASALQTVDLWDVRNKLIGELSGGQQQRACIARALAGEPELLILDEPTVGVEVEVKNDFYRLIKKLNEDHDLTVLLVTHDIDTVAHEAMHIACIDKTLYFHDSVESFLKGRADLVHPHT